MSADGTLTAIESLQHSSAGGVAIRGDHSDAGSPSDSSDDGKMAVPVSLTAATAAAAAAAAAEEAQSPTGAAKAEAITILLGAGMAEDEALTALDATARYLSTAAGASAGDGGLTEETVDLDDNSTAFECAPPPVCTIPCVSFILHVAQLTTARVSIDTRLTHPTLGLHSSLPGLKQSPGARVQTEWCIPHMPYLAVKIHVIG